MILMASFLMHSTERAPLIGLYQGQQARYNKLDAVLESPLGEWMCSFSWLASFGKVERRSRFQAGQRQHPAS